MNAHTVSKRLVQPELGRGNCRSFTILEGCLHLNADDFARRPNRVLMFYEGLTDKDIPAKEFISSPVGNYVDIYCFPGPVMGGANKSYCQSNGEWKPKLGRCPTLNCRLSDLTEKRFFQDAKLTKPGINNTDIAKDGQTAKAVCCGHKYAEDFNKWPYTFTCQGGTWFPKTECNDDQYEILAFCNADDLVEKKFFVAAKRVDSGIKDTPYQLHGKNATAVCCGNKYSKDPKQWPYKFICQHGKWLPDIECNDEIDE